MKTLKINKSHLGLWGIINMETGYMQLFNNIRKLKAGTQPIMWILVKISSKECVFASQPHGEMILVDKNFILLPSRS